MLLARLCRRRFLDDIHTLRCVHHLRSQLATHKAPSTGLSMAARKPQLSEQSESERVSTVHFTIDRHVDLKALWLKKRLALKGMNTRGIVATGVAKRSVTLWAKTTRLAGLTAVHDRGLTKEAT